MAPVYGTETRRQPTRTARRSRAVRPPKPVAEGLGNGVGAHQVVGFGGDFWGDGGGGSDERR
jgi:hypothetical protein